MASRPACRCPGIPALGITTQNLENPLLRRQLGLEAGERGVVVLHVDYSGSAEGHLQPRDVITAIDGLAIANNGTVQHMGQHPHRAATTSCSATATSATSPAELQDQARGRRRCTVRRRGTQAPWMPLVPRSRYDQPPAYFVYGGLVFQTLTRDYLTTWDKWWNKGAQGDSSTTTTWASARPAQHEVDRS